MITVQSLIRSSSGERFVRIEEFSGRIVDLDYIEGVVELVISGVPVIDKDMWDYIDQTWSYLADCISEFGATGSSSTYFPDQPIKLSFKRVGGGQVLVTSTPSSGPRNVAVSEGELFSALRTAGSKFFDRMAVLVPSESESYLREKNKMFHELPELQ